MKKINIQEHINRYNEIITKLDDYNTLLINNDPITQTEEFNLDYLNLNNELQKLTDIIDKYNKPTQNGFLNNVSLWIWPYMIVLIILSLYPIFYLLDLYIILPFLENDTISKLSPNLLKAVIVFAYLIYPVVLLEANIIPLLCLKKKENKKAYLILSIIFWVSMLVSIILSIINILILPFVG